MHSLHVSPSQVNVPFVFLLLGARREDVGMGEKGEELSPEVAVVKEEAGGTVCVLLACAEQGLVKRDANTRGM